MAACADKNLEYLCINICTHLPLLQSVLSASWEMACFSSHFNLCLKPKSPRCSWCVKSVTVFVCLQNRQVTELQTKMENYSETADEGTHE